MKNAGLMLVFLLATYISLSAYDVYAYLVSSYNFGFAMVIWSILQVFSLRTIYIPFECWVLKICGRELRNEEAKMPIIKAFQRNGKLMTIQGIFQALSLFLMLPYLNDKNDALFFIIIYSLTGLIKVGFAIRMFKDPVQNPRWYFLGLVIAIIGGILFKIDFTSSQQLFTNNYILMFVIVPLKLICEVANSLIVRKMTDKDLAHDEVVPIKVASEISSYFEIIIALPVGIFLFLTQTDTYMLPTMPNLVGLLWIGLVISLFSSLIRRITNFLKHSVTVPLQATRPLAGFLATVLISQDFTNFSHQFLCVSLVCIGALVAMSLGKPFPKK